MIKTKTVFWFSGVLVASVGVKGYKVLTARTGAEKQNSIRVSTKHNTVLALINMINHLL
jgi:hypothetical protein